MRQFRITPIDFFGNIISGYNTFISNESNSLDDIRFMSHCLLRDGYLNHNFKIEVI